MGGLDFRNPFLHRSITPSCWFLCGAEAIESGGHAGENVCTDSGFLRHQGHECIRGCGILFDILSDATGDESAHSGDLRAGDQLHALHRVRRDGGLDAIPDHERLLPVIHVFLMLRQSRGNGPAGFEREPL